jgi:RHH-type rel operon transcriptional repressor/antitoxin RelB
MLAIRLPQSIEKRLEKLAERTGRTKTYYAREAILEHLEDLEDIYLAEKRLEDLRAGRSRTYTLDEVTKNLGLDDSAGRKRGKRPGKTRPGNRPKNAGVS